MANLLRRRRQRIGRRVLLPWRCHAHHHDPQSESVAWSCLSKCVLVCRQMLSECNLTGLQSQPDMANLGESQES